MRLQHESEEIFEVLTITETHTENIVFNFTYQ